MVNAACCDFDKFIKAMTSETRLQILLLLSEREMCVADLYEALDVSQPTISHHLAVLRHINLVLVRHEGRHNFYRVNPTCIAEHCLELLARFNDETARNTCYP